MGLWNVVQAGLPQHAISRVVGAVAGSRQPWLAGPLIRVFTRLYRLDLSDAAEPGVGGYRSFNELFTRALRADARPQDRDPLALTSPVDGTLSEFGAITDGRLTQAKGRHYSLTALLAGDAEAAGRYMDGRFVTIYLAPYNYHRIHMPAAGRATRMSLVPGRLFSVNAATAAGIDGLFARNERVVCQFDGDLGPWCMVLVGALNVGSIATTWHGNVTPPRSASPRHWDYADGAALARGDEMGRFNLGSTVILLLPPGNAELTDGLAVGQTLRVGERIGGWTAPEG